MAGRIVAFGEYVLKMLMMRGADRNLGVLTNAEVALRTESIESIGRKL
jgi:hypothetical protein